MFVDGKKEDSSCWLRFVNCARTVEERNLEAYQYTGNIHYRTIKDILPNVELLVWGGEEYANKLGIDSAQIEKFTSRSYRPRPC